MAVLGLSHYDRMIDFRSIDLLPDLEESVFFGDVLVQDVEEAFLQGMDDWWGEFVEDMYL